MSPEVTDDNNQDSKKKLSLSDLLTQMRGNTPPSDSDNEPPAMQFKQAPEGTDTGISAPIQYLRDLDKKREDFGKDINTGIRNTVDRGRDVLLNSDTASKYPNAAAAIATGIDTAKDMTLPPHEQGGIPENAAAAMPGPMRLGALGKEAKAAQAESRVARVQDRGLPAAPSKRADAMSKLPSQTQMQQDWNALSGEERAAYDNDVSKFKTERVRDAKINMDQAEDAYKNRNTPQSTAKSADLGDYWKTPKPAPAEERTIDYRNFNKRNEQR